MLRYMNRRTEPRFEICAPAEVTLLDDPSRAVSAVLTAMSADGLRLRASEELPTGRLIAVELEHHMLLAEVRYINPDGSRYAIGAKRIHTLAKELPLDSTRLAKVEALVNDFQISALTREINSAENESSTTELDGLPRDCSSESHPEPLEPATSMDEAEIGADQAPEPDFRDPALAEDFHAEPSMNFHSIPKATEPILPIAMVPGHPQSTSAAFLNALHLQMQKIPASEPVAVRESASSQLENRGLTLKTRAVLFGIVVGGTMVQVAAMWFGTYRVSANIDRLPKFGAVSAAPPVSRAVIAHAKPGEAGKTRLATVNATANDWITACSDGKIVFENLLRPQESMEVRFSHSALIRLGNAGGAAVTVDGKPLGALGASGVVRVLEVEPDQTRLLPPNRPADPGVCRLP
jgi:hypothetical protein